MRPPVTAKAITDNGRPPAITTTPAVPLTTAGRANGESPPNDVAWAATVAAPRITVVYRARSVPPSDRSTTSGCSTATSPSMSPSRAAARNASTTSRCRTPISSGSGDCPRTRRRARLAS
ncbi:hypothetical protein [Micromonospora craniellae]|uniref:Uncharacterized protein n=1 Tax=Micromonospora craniellae TaxID=2294034 RepID=A0A372G363_9ACTN|nr:hypothetical protein ID554_28325 [Micromonospora craniellae]RFS47150.1 hypothetical protein D0Q02_08360 [Micromonospora craniellae]